MAYTKQEWVDHYVDDDGTILQQGTPVDCTHMNYMEEGIRKANRHEVVLYYDDEDYLCVEKVTAYDAAEEAEEDASTDSEDESTDDTTDDSTE